MTFCTLWISLTLLSHDFVTCNPKFFFIEKYDDISRPDSHSDQNYYEYYSSEEYVDEEPVEEYDVALREEAKDEDKRWKSNKWKKLVIDGHKLKYEKSFESEIFRSNANNPIQETNSKNFFTLMPLNSYRVSGSSINQLLFGIFPIVLACLDYSRLANFWSS